MLLFYISCNICCNRFSDGLTRREPGAKKVGGHFLLFRGKEFSKKGDCLEGVFSISKQSNLQKKKILIVVRPVFSVSKQYDFVIV